MTQPWWKSTLILLQPFGPDISEGGLSLKTLEILYFSLNVYWKQRQTVSSMSLCCLTCCKRWTIEQPASSVITTKNRNVGLFNASIELNTMAKLWEHGYSLYNAFKKWFTMVPRHQPQTHTYKAKHKEDGKRLLFKKKIIIICLVQHLSLLKKY